jgi:8-oxo-dGTP pyrophosphatase MutT (NUDIX family)
MSARDEGVFVVVLMKTKKHSPQVLLQLRENTGLHDGKFGFPGGKRHNNEPWPVAAERELYEETGLIVNRNELQKLCRFGGRGLDGAEWRCTFYYCVVESCCGTAQVKEPKKHNRIQWYSIKKLPKNVVPVVHKVISDLSNSKIVPEVQ